MSGAEKSVFITGASRGIGAATVVEFADRQYDVAIGYRSMDKRARKVLEQVEDISPGSRHQLLRGDIADIEARRQLIYEVKDWSPKLGALILNAAGGLEKGKDADYAIQINRDAQVGLLDGLSEALTPNGTAVFVTSHWAHLHGKAELPPFDYEPVASSKRIGEDRLRDRIPELTQREIRLIVVSGGIVTGTFVGDYSKREFPDFFASQQEIGNVVTTEDMAKAIADAVEDKELPSGHTVIVGAPFEALLS